MLNSLRFSFGCKLYQCGSNQEISTEITKCLAKKKTKTKKQPALDKLLPSDRTEGSILKSLKMLPVFLFSFPFQDVLLHLLGTVHNGDEEVSPSSQGQQSLRLAVNEKVHRKD